MRLCTSVTDRQTDGHCHRSISARCIYYICHCEPPHADVHNNNNDDDDDNDNA